MLTLYKLTYHVKNQFLIERSTISSEKCQTNGNDSVQNCLFAAPAHLHIILNLRNLGFSVSVRQTFPGWNDDPRHKLPVIYS